MRSPRTPLVASVLAALVCWSVPALAQDAPAPAHLAYVDGSVVIEREGELHDATYGLPFLPGDRLQTTGGRVEVLFPDGTLLHLDERSSVELLDETLLRLTDGRLLLVVYGAADASNALPYQIDTPAASVFTDGPGEYRVAMLSTRAGLQTELAVVRGYASISTDLGIVSLGAGELSLARDGAPPAFAQAFNSARFDAFDTWSLARRGERVTRAASSQYLPSELRVYGGTFDRHGSWAYEEPYGYVWYPTVAVEWRPYHHGYWTSYPRYGWTWIGLDPWGWPTHHYGRWGYKRSRWYWIPGRVWAPAWVHWVAAPSYVGWSPLGWDNRPVFAFAFGTPSVWASWVVIPRASFGVRHHYVHHHYVPGHRIPRGTSFASYRSAPIEPPHRPASVRRAPDRGPALQRIQPGTRVSGDAVAADITRINPRGRAAAGDGRSAVVQGGAQRRAAGAVPSTSAPSAAADRAQTPARSALPRAVRGAPSQEAGRDAQPGTAGRGDAAGTRAGQRPSAVRRTAPSETPAPADGGATRIVPRTSGGAGSRVTPPPSTGGASRAAPRQSGSAGEARVAPRSEPRSAPAARPSTTRSVPPAGSSRPAAQPRGDVRVPEPVREQAARPDPRRVEAPRSSPRTAEAPRSSPRSVEAPRAAPPSTAPPARSARPRSSVDGGAAPPASRAPAARPTPAPSGGRSAAQPRAEASPRGGGDGSAAPARGDSGAARRRSR